MESKEWRKVKKMLTFCKDCSFMEINLDPNRNFTFHRFCLCSGGLNLIDLSSCPQKKF